jgi:cation diffusion facilitator family transporter
MATAGRNPDSRLLLISVWVSAAFAVGSLLLGVIIGSQMIVFDGLYSFASVGLSLLAVVALRTSRKGADERYPWGREVWEPLTIVVKAAALGGLCVYALIGAVGELARGGREISAVPAVIYAVVAIAIGLAVSLYLRRGARRGSDLVRAEAAEWMGDTLLSLGVLAGFLIALVLELTGQKHIARYVDPAMVVIVSALFLRIPAGLLAGGFREVLTMAPAPPIRDQLWSCVTDVERRYRFTESFLRSSKVGSRLDVQIDYVVGADSLAQTVRDFDAVRQEIDDLLAPLGYQKWVSVMFTADRKWAA